MRLTIDLTLQPPLPTARGLTGTQSAPIERGKKSYAPGMDFVQLRRDRGEVLVIGLGNPLLGDDGVGWHIAQQVERELVGASAPVEVDYLAVGGLALMERLAGCRRAIIADAIVTGQTPPGTLYRLALDDLPAAFAGHLHSAHDASLAVALKAGAALGIPLPEQVYIFGVEAASVCDFAETLSPPVAACVPQAARAVLEVLRQFELEDSGSDFS